MTLTLISGTHTTTRGANPVDGLRYIILVMQVDVEFAVNGTTMGVAIRNIVTSTDIDNGDIVPLFFCFIKDLVKDQIAYALQVNFLSL